LADYDYLDFDLALEELGGGRYRARVIGSPSGQARGEFSLPFEDMELENFLLRIGRPRSGVRRLESPENEAAREFGTKLFDSLFAGDVGMQWQRSVDAAERDGRGLRLRLRLADAPALRELPWEYLHSQATDRFVALSSWTPIVRHVSIDRPADMLTVVPPLRILAMVSAPSDAPGLDVDAEWARLEESLADVTAAGLIQVTTLEDATLRSLQRAVRNETFHVFHFIGHGGFDEAAQDGILLLEDDNGRAREVTGRDLGTILADDRSLRLAVLNACEGARTSITDPFAGVAHSLILAGMPAVVAMQFEISDRAAIVFSHEFYAAVAEGRAVDAALSEARRAIFSQSGGVEWGTPVLHMRTEDGVLFDIDTAQAQPVAPVPPSPVETLPPLDDEAAGQGAMAPAGVAGESSDPSEGIIPPSGEIGESGDRRERIIPPSAGLGERSDPRGVDPPTTVPAPPVQEDAGVDRVPSAGSDEAVAPTIPSVDVPARDASPEPPPRGTEGQQQRSFGARYGWALWVGLLLVAAIFFVWRGTSGGGTEVTVAPNQTTGAPQAQIRIIESTEVVAVPADFDIAIDGSLEDWASVTTAYAMPAVIFESPTGLRNGEDSAGVVRVAHDDAGLYIAAEVDDDVYSQGNDGDQIWRGDAVDINLSTAPPGSASAVPDADDFQLTMTPRSFSGNASHALFQGTGARTFTTARTDLPVAVAGQVSEDGSYLVEALIPWSVFGLGGQPDGLTAMFLTFDNDGERQSDGTWIQRTVLGNVPGAQFQEPQTWGALRFDS
jgi:hypothetical protein